MVQQIRRKNVEKKRRSYGWCLGLGDLKPTKRGARFKEATTSFHLPYHIEDVLGDKFC